MCENFSIILNREPPVFYVGEELKGNLCLKLESKTKVNSIKASILGTEQYYDATSEQMQTENCLDVSIIFLEKNPTVNSVFEAGQFLFPFKINLSDDLPRSFKISNTKTKYSIKATLDIPWRVDITCIKIFQVMRILDLNLYDSRLALSFEAQRTSAVYESDVIGMPETFSIRFSVVKGGFVPGESIVFNALIDNKTDRRIKNIRVTLFQDIHVVKEEHLQQALSSNVPLLDVPPKNSRVQRTMLTETQYCGRVKPREIVFWERGLVEVPYYAIPSANDRTIQVFYKIKLTNSEDCSLSLPIMIGTVPIFAEQTLQTIETTTVINQYSRTLSLPTYEECVNETNVVTVANT